MIWKMREEIRRALSDPQLGETLLRATSRTVSKRDAAIDSAETWELLRDHARQLKLHTLTHIERYLGQFMAEAHRNGWHVHTADDATEANRITVALAQKHGVTLAIKGKSMVSEEIGLNHALETCGVTAIESDLGELIVQLLGQPPSHITAPAIHTSLEQILRLFRDRLAYAPPTHIEFSENGNVPEHQRAELATDLSSHAACYLRERFQKAEMGISGANFLIAESGRLVTVENEANIRLATTLPRVHVAIVGFEKLIPRERDLATFLKLLTISATGQRAASYVSLLGSASDGVERHVIILDNGRSNVLANAEHADLLSCIRCGACMNICPVFRTVGGHGYGGVYGGPIGAALLPNLVHLERYRELPFASSLCGACSAICPLKIPLHDRLLQLRRTIVSQHGSALGEATAMRAFGAAATRPALFRLAGRLIPGIASLGQHVPPVSNWTQGRALPEPCDERFSDWWPDRGAETADDD